MDGVATAAPAVPVAVVVLLEVVVEAVDVGETVELVGLVVVVAPVESAAVDVVGATTVGLISTEVVAVVVLVVSPAL